MTQKQKRAEWYYDVVCIVMGFADFIGIIPIFSWKMASFRFSDFFFADSDFLLLIPIFENLLPW